MEFAVAFAALIWGVAQKSSERRTFQFWDPWGPPVSYWHGGSGNGLIRSNERNSAGRY